MPGKEIFTNDKSGDHEKFSTYKRKYPEIPSVNRKIRITRRQFIQRLSNIFIYSSSKDILKKPDIISKLAQLLYGIISPKKDPRRNYLNHEITYPINPFTENYFPPMNFNGIPEYLHQKPISPDSLDIQIPLPPKITVDFWGNVPYELVFPDEVWRACVNAFEITGVNPYLLAVLAYSENPKFDPTQINELGMQGLFQFNPDTFTLYSRGEGSAFDISFSTLVAGRMLKNIGLSEKFYGALIAWQNRDPLRYDFYRSAFIDNFTGENGSQCWNASKIHAEKVIDTTILLINASIS